MSSLALLPDALCWWEWYNALPWHRLHCWRMSRCSTHQLPATCYHPHRDTTGVKWISYNDTQSCEHTVRWTLSVINNMAKLVARTSLIVCFVKKVNVAHTRLPSVGFWSWSRFLAVSLQVTRIINLTVDCHYFPPGLQLPPQPLWGLLPILLLGKQRHNGCEQFAQDCYPTASRLRIEPSTLTIRLPSHLAYIVSRTIILLIVSWIQYCWCKLIYYVLCFKLSFSFFVFFVSGIFIF